MTEKRGKSSGVRKAAAAVVALAFVFTSVSEPFAQTSFWAERQTSRGQAASSEDRRSQSLLTGLSWPTESLNPVLGIYRLPASLGSVVETYVAESGKTGPTLLHLQDAHGLFPAQYNAAQTLAGLLRAGWWSGDTAALTVYQEGGAGPAKVDWLSAFPFADIREKVAKAHLQKGEMTGEEYRSVVETSGTVRLIGVETENLYKKNLAARHQTAAARAAADAYMAAVQARLNGVKSTVYPESLKKLDALLGDFAGQRISFVQYAQALRATSPAGASPETYPNLDALSRLSRLESTLDLRALSQERAEMVEKIGQRSPVADIENLAARALAFRQGRQTAAEFYESLLAVADGLKRQKVDLPTRRLRDYVGYLKLSETLRHESLVAEAEQLKNRLLDSFAKDDKVWRLVNLDRRVTLEKLLWRQEMTPDQYAAFRQDGALDWHDVEGYLAAHGAGAPAPDLSWAKALPQVRDYYELALERDVALVKNTLADMEKTGARRAVLIAGGFHTPGLTRLLRQSGANYAVVQPQFTTDPTPADLTISQEPRAFSHTVREANQLVFRDGTPLSQNLPGQSLIEMFAKGSERVLSVPKGEAAANERLLTAYRDWLKGRGVDLELREVAQLVDNAGNKAQTLLFGEFNGQVFIIASDLASDQITWITEDTVRNGETANLNKRFSTLLQSRPGLQKLWADVLNAFRSLSAAQGQGNTAQLRQALNDRWAAFSAAGQIRQLAQTAVNVSVLPTAQVQKGEGALAAARRATVSSSSWVWGSLVRSWPTTRKWAVGALLFLAAPVAMAGEAAGLSVGVSPAGILSLLVGVTALGWAGFSIARSRPLGPRLRTLLLAVALGVPALLATSAFNSAEAAQLSADGAHYTVEMKDTVWSMARQDLLKAGAATMTNTDIAQRVAAYAEANPGVDLHRIAPGQTLERPVLAGETAPGPASNAPAASTVLNTLDVSVPAGAAASAPGQIPVAGLAPTAVPAARDRSDGGATGQGPTPGSEGTGPVADQPAAGGFAWPRSLDIGVLSKVGAAVLMFFMLPDTGAAFDAAQQVSAAGGTDTGMHLKMATEMAGPSFSFSGLLESLRMGFSLYLGPWAAAVQGWLAEASMADWVTPTFAMAGVVGALRLWRGAPNGKDVQRWADRLADRMTGELSKGPRTAPKTWNAPLRRWRRNQLTPEDQARVNAAPTGFRQWMLRNYLLLKQGQFPRYNTYGAHGRYISFIGLSEIKRMTARVEKSDETLAALRQRTKELDKKIKRLVSDRGTLASDEKRRELSELNRARDQIDTDLVVRRTILQRRFVDALRQSLAERRDGVLGEAGDSLREQRDVMWRTFEGTFAYYESRLVPEGFQLQMGARLFLTFAAVGRLAFTGIFLSQVFFFPSFALTAASWLVLGPLLYNISRSFVDPLLVMVFMMFGPPPQGHARRDFLEVVREHAQKTGRPYAFSVEVPKMSGNPLDGYLKTDIGAAYFQSANGLSAAFDLSPAAPSAALQFPGTLDAAGQTAFAQFIQGKMWEGFRLDVAVTFEEARDKNDAVIPGVTVARLRPAAGTAGQRFETRVNEILAEARGEPQRLSPDGVRVIDHEWVEVDVTENYVNPIGVGFPEIGGPTTAEEKTWAGLGAMIEKEYGLPLSLAEDREPNISVRFDQVGEQVVRRVVYRFGVPRQYRNEIAQNLDTTTRFLDTIHLEADVWAAYRRVDIDNLRQTLRDTAVEPGSPEIFTISFAMPTNTSNALLIPYELENLQKLQAEMDAEFPGRVSFVYFNQGMEWAEAFLAGPAAVSAVSAAIGDADPFKKLGTSFTLFDKEGARLYVTVQGSAVTTVQVSAQGRRTVRTLSRAEATELIKGIDASAVDRLVQWKRGGWGKKLGNVAGLEWLKSGHTRPPAYNNPDGHENFTNPDAPIFPNANLMAGDILGYFRNDVVVHRADGSSVRFTGSKTDANQISVTESRGETRTLSRAEANKELARRIADLHTDRMTDGEGHPLEPDDLSVVMDDKNSILPGAVEAAIGVAEHPANQGVVGFNPAIEVDPPRNTRGGQAGSYFSSILLDYLDKSRVIHNMYDARFKAGLFGKMSAMYGKIFKRAAYGDSFTDERVTVARALSHDWQESQFSPTEAVYGDVTHTFQLMETSRDEKTREAVQVFRMQLGNRFELLRLVMSPVADHPGRVSLTVERLNPEGQWATWRAFAASETENAKVLVTRVAAYLTNAIGVRERDLLTLAGVVDRDFRWLRGDLQMQSTAKPYEKDALPYAHRYHLGGIDFRLNGDPSFLIVLAGLIPLWLFPDQALLVNKTLAYVLFGITMLGVAFRGHFLYPAYFDAMSRVQVLTVSPWLGKPLLWGLLLVFGVKNFFLSLLTISATTLMSLPIALKRTFYLETVAKVIEFVKNVPSVWVTSSATVVRELMGVRIADTWKSEISLMNLVVFGGLSFAAFAGLIYTGNIYFGALFPLGISIIVASILTGWIVAHFAGQAYRRDDRRAMMKRWFQVYGLSALIAAVIFFAPVTNFLTDLKIQALRTPTAAEVVLKQLADPVTKPRPYTGVDISGGLALQVQRTEPIAQEAAPKIMQAAVNVGAGVKAEVFPGVESIRLTGIPNTALPLPGDVRTSPYTTAQFEPPKPLDMLKKPQLSEEQTKKLAYLLSQLDRMGDDTTKWENIAIYGGSTALITLVPPSAIGLKVADVGAYLKMLSTGYPWLREPMVAKYWAQTALLMDINATIGDAKTSKAAQVRSVKDISQLLLWDKIKDVWNVDYTRFVQKGQVLRNPKTGGILISEEDYRDLAETASGSMDKYEVLSTAVINLHYGLGYPLDKITPELVWRFTRLSYEIEKSWAVVVPSVDIKPVQLFPKSVGKVLRVAGNITFFLPVKIPILSDAHLEMIPMVTAFYQEPGGLQDFFTQMLEHNEKDLRGASNEDYIKAFLDRIGADYIQRFSSAANFPADPALYDIVRDRMTEDLKKFNKKPTEKDLRLAYLQTEYNLGRIALFNRNKVESKDLGAIRAAALSVARELSAVQSIAKSLAPRLYESHMKMEPGVLEVEGIMLYLLQGEPERKAEYLRVFRDVLKTSEAILADMAQNKWAVSDAYSQHVLSLLPPTLVAEMSPKAKEYNVLRDLSMLQMNIQLNGIKKADGKPYAFKEIMEALLAVKARVAGLRVPEKPGIMATMLLHSLKMKTQHPEVTDKEYWDGNRLPVLRYWAAWSATPELMKKLDADPHWAWYRNKINGQIEAEMGAKITDPEVRQFNAVQSMAQLADAVYTAFPNLKKEHQGKPARVADLLLTLAHRSEAYAQFFGTIKNMPVNAIGFQEYYVVAGYELNGMTQKFDPKKAFEKEIEGFVLRPVNDLWNTGLYESLPKGFVEAVRVRMKDTQERLGIGDRPIKADDLKIQAIQAFYKMAASAMFSEKYPTPLPAYSAAFLKDIVALGRELVDYAVQVGEQSAGLPRVNDYVVKEPGILENEAIQIYLLKKRAGGNFNVKNYMTFARTIFTKIDSILKDQPGILKSETFAKYRGIKSSLLSELANKQMSDRGRDFLALRSIANLVVNAEHNDMRPKAPLAARALSAEGWMAAYLDAWDHFENAPKYGGKKYQHIPYREEGFVDMVTLLKQKWGFTKFWEAYYYERLNQVEKFMSDPAFVKFIRTQGGTGEKLLWVINDDIFRKSGIRFDSNHPIFTFNGVIGVTEMFIDAAKKFPGTEINYQLLAARYLRYYDLFHTPDPATGKLRFPNLPYSEEGFIESLVTGGYNFEANGGRFEDELRIMKLRDVDALMGAKLLDPEEKFQGIFVRGYLEGIIRSESSVPPGVSTPVIDFFILQKIVGIGQTYNMLTGPSVGVGQPSSVDVQKDLPVLKTATRALVFVHHGVRQQTADKKDLYPKLRPIFNILGESEKWVGRMHATGLLKEERFQEIFTNYIDVLERHFDELKGTYLPPEQGAGGARYLGELGTYLRVLKENLRKDAAAIESRFVTRDQQTRQLGQAAGLEEEKAGGTEAETRARVVFVRPEIDESQFILDAGYIVTEILRDMEREIGASGNAALKNVTVDRLMTHYFKTLAHLKTTHYKNQIMQIQSYRDSEALGRLNGKINNYAMRFAFIDYLVYSAQGDPNLRAFFESKGLNSAEQFIDRFYANLEIVQKTDGLKQALEELRNANEYSAEGVEFSYAMMLTLNHKITPETLKRVAAHIPEVLRDYNDYLLRPGGAAAAKSLKFRVDSAVVLYEALARELALARPLGVTGDRMEVKQKRTNEPWMVDTLVKAVYGNLFGIYLEDDIPEHKKLMKEWEIKAFGKDLKSMVQQLANQPTVMGQKNAYFDEIAKVDEAIRERTAKYEAAKKDLRESLADDYQIQIRILEQIRASLEERMGYLLQLADTMDRTYAEGVKDKNQATMEMLILLSAIGFGAGLLALSRRRRDQSPPKNLNTLQGLRDYLTDLNAQRNQVPYLRNAALAIYLGLPAAYGLYFGVGLPRLAQDAGSIFNQAPYQFEAPRSSQGTVFSNGGFVVQQSQEVRDGKPVVEHKILSGGYLVGRVELTTGYAEFMPGAVPGANGLSYPLNPGPSLVMLGYGENKPDGKKAYSYRGALSQVSYAVDANGQLVLSGTLRDAGGAFEAKNYQMAVSVTAGKTHVSVSGDFTAQRPLNVSEFNIGSLNTQSYIGIPQGAPSPSDRSLSLEAQGNTAANRVYIYFGNDQKLPASGLTPWTVQSVSLGGTAYNNTPNVRIVPESITFNGRKIDPVAAYTLLPNQFDRHNVAIAPIIGGGTPLSLQTGGKISVRYTVDITPVVVKTNGAAAPAAPASGATTTPTKKPFSLWQTGMAFLAFAGAAYFGFDAVASGSAGQMALGGFVGLLGSWGSLFYGRHLTLSLAAVAVRPDSGSGDLLNLDVLAARHGLASLEVSRDLPAGVLAEIEPSTGRGFIAPWLVTPWARVDGVRRSLLTLVLAHEAQRLRLKNFELIQTPLLYLIKPFQIPAYKSLDPIFAAVDGRSFGQRLEELSARDEEAAGWALRRRSQFDGKVLDGRAGLKAIYNPGRADATAAKYTADPLARENLAAGRPSIDAGAYFFRGGDHPILRGHVLHVTRALHAQSLTAVGREALAGLLAGVGESHIVFRNEGIVPEASGASVPLREHNQLIPKSSLTALFGDDRLPIENADRLALGRVGAARVSRLLDWPAAGYVIDAPADSATAVADVSRALGHLTDAFVARRDDAAVRGAALIGTVRDGRVVLYLIPRQIESETAANQENRNKFSGSFGALETAGLVIQSKMDKFTEMKESDWLTRLTQVAASSADADKLQRYFEPFLEPAAPRAAAATSLLGIAAAALTLAVASRGGDLGPVILSAVEAARDHLTANFRLALAGLGEWAQMGSGMFSFATNTVLKSLPAAPALIVAAPMAGLGGASFLSGALGLVAGPTLWALPDSLHSLLRGGGFLGAPGVADSRKGDALVVSLPEGKLSPAVGRALLQFLSGIGARLESDGGRAPVHVELVIGAEAPSAAQREQLTAAFRQLAQSGGVSKDLQDRLTVAVAHRDPEALKLRLGELALASNINVLSTGEEAPFWFGLGVPLRLFAVRLLEKLTQVDVEVVFTGAEADAVARLSGGRVENGQLRLKALGRPLDILDADTRKIETFNQQA